MRGAEHYLHVGDHQVLGEPSPAVDETAPVQQVHSAEEHMHQQRGSTAHTLGGPGLHQSIA